MVDLLLIPVCWDINSAESRLVDVKGVEGIVLVIANQLVWEVLAFKTVVVWRTSLQVRQKKL